MNEAELIAGIEPESVRAIRLGQRDGMGPSALVDADDYEGLMENRWHPSGTGYAVRSGERVAGKRKTILMAREIMGLSPGDGLQTDHINRCRLDNRKSNLRVVKHRENSQNLPPQSGTSKYRGVSWVKARKKWAAYVCLDGVQHNLGNFEDEQDAADAASNWRRDNMPFATGVLKTEEV